MAGNSQRRQGNIPLPSAALYPQGASGPVRMLLTSFVSRLCSLSLALMLQALLCVAATAQVSFVQITDPHLHDDGPEAAENRVALEACIKKTNELMAAGADYKFAVITGDIGIEKIVKPLLETKKALAKDKAGADELGRVDDEINNGLRGAARQLASTLATSRIGVWLILPGNNDLIDERTETVGYYQEFVRQLTAALPGKRVIDLCPTDDPNSGVFPWGDGYLFIGFNNASFKNNNDPNRISAGGGTAEVVSATDPSPLPVTKVTEEQLKYVRQVIDRVNTGGTRHAYIFYHIPEVDDPHPILNFDLGLLGDRRLSSKDRYAFSSWFVDGRVRQLWEKVVADERVTGLFAGHFHDWRRDTYQNNRWLVTPYYMSGSLSKLYVCPPLATKRQDKTPSQARGFQVVDVDGSGRVAVDVFWYDAAKHAFDSQPERQLALGRMYEDNDQLKEAEAAYTKALESESAPVRQRALDSLRRVVEDKNSYRRKFITSPFGSMVERGTTIFFTALPAALIVLLVWWLADRHGKIVGRNKVAVVAFTDSTQNKLGANFAKVFEVVIGVMHLHYRARGPLRGMANLPVLARSQQAEIVELAESAAPGWFGKMLAWATRRANQPEYSINGSIQSDGASLTIIVILTRAGDTLGTWRENTALPTGGGPSLLDIEEALAYKVLIFLKEYMN
jgi:hypothetical protein